MQNASGPHTALGASIAAVCSVEPALFFFFFPILPQWLTSGYMSMDRNSAGHAAQALKTKMLAERSWWSPVAFQRSQKQKAKLGEEKGELPEEGLVSIACSLQMELRKWSVSGNRIYMVSPPVIAVRIEWTGNTKKVTRNPKGEVSGAQALYVGNRTYQQSLGFGQWRFCHFEHWPQGPRSGNEDTCRKGLAWLSWLFALPSTDFCWAGIVSVTGVYLIWYF